jgi:hypothetical protein
MKSPVTTFRRIKRADFGSGRTTYELPPGDYYVTDVTTIPESLMFEIDGVLEFVPGFYKSKHGHGYMALTSLDTDGAYEGSNGVTYEGCVVLISKNICDHEGGIQEDFSVFTLHTFTDPLTVTLTSIGDNFGVNGIELKSIRDNFHLKIIENEDREDEIRQQMAEEEN